ncbi:MAG: type II toxin-antitoxin system HicA family toxin [Trebonia sp.]
MARAFRSAGSGHRRGSLVPPLPVLAGSRVVRALEKAGFKVVRIRGSHHVLRHPDGRGTSVPVHGNQDVRVGTLRGILRDCGLTADEFLKLLDLGPDERSSCHNGSEQSALANGVEQVGEASGCLRCGISVMA